MTQIWKGENSIAVTRVKAGPCVIVQVKDEKKDGYKAVQLGYGEKKEKNIKKPQRNHLKDLGNYRYLKEFRTEKNSEELKRGDRIDVSTFEAGDIVDLIGNSKGKGFQGGVKRHGFAGQSATHGTKDQERMPGSAGATGPARVFKGMRMPGRMGNERVTTKNLEIIEVDIENNILYIKGAVPGSINGMIYVSGEGDLKVSAPKEVKKEEVKEKVEEVKAEEKKEEKVEEVKAEEKVEEKKEVEDKKVEENK